MQGGEMIETQSGKLKYHNFRAQYPAKYEDVDYIVWERINGTRQYRGLSVEELANMMGVSSRKMGSICNGHGEIPKEWIFGLVKFLNFPKEHFYRLKWERV